MIARRALLAFPVPLLGRARRRSAVVIAHRGHHTAHPDNSLAAIASAIALGVDLVELDVRTAPDGTLVLHHDPLPAVLPATLPRFEDALRLLRRSRTGLYLDWKAAEAAALQSALRRHRMIGRTVVYGAPERLAALQLLAPSIRVMPEAVDAATLDRVLAQLRPQVVAFDRRDFREDLVAVARRAGVDVYVDRLGADDTEAAWEEALRRGASGIQTDRPAELLTYLDQRT